MTFTADARHEVASRGRNDSRSILVPSAVVCAVLIASGASLVHWRLSAPSPAHPVLEAAPPIRTWAVERLHPAPARPTALLVDIDSDTSASPDPASVDTGPAEVAPPVEEAPIVAAVGLALSASTNALVASATLPDRQHAALVPHENPSSSDLAAAGRLPPPAVAAQHAPAASPSKIAADRSNLAETEVAAPRMVPSLPGASELVERIPVPPPRPDFASPRDEPARVPERRRTARLAPAAPAPAAAKPEDNRSILEQLFGTSQPAPRAALAYAPPDGGLGGLFGGRKPSYDSQTAIYEIATHTVYLPDGRRLEAHSGLGAGLDDPRSVNQRMRGATPPNVYELQPREQLFHGVKALRLTPVGSGGTYGRNGLLAHTFMLGPRGDSNGCVVFRDYDSFLQAYESGTIKRLAVVASMN